MSAFDALKSGARALALSSSSKKRHRSGDAPPKNKRTLPLPLSLSHEEEVYVNVDLLNTKMDMLKTEQSAFKLDSVVHCIAGEEGRQITQTPFVFIFLALELISQESRRNIMINIACNMLRVAMSSRCSEQDLIDVLHLLTYKIVPILDGGSDQLGLGEHNLVKAIADAYGATVDVIKTRIKELGDLGLVAQTTRSTQSTLFNFKPKSLTVSHVYKSFQEIAQISGNDSKGEKLRIVKRLLSASYECEPKYLIRLLLPKKGLRVGFSETTLLEVLGRAATFLDKDKRLSVEHGAAIVRQAYAVRPVYKEIVHALFSTGIRMLLKSCGPSVGVAMEPMLCKPIGSVKDALSSFGNCPTICEYKYDGERAQIHFTEDNGRVEIFSRNRECRTGKYPDVVDTVKRLKRVSVASFILDCEIVAYDRVSNKLSSFQKLMTRGRKDVDINEIKISVCIFAFDMLYLNNESLIEEQLGVRRMRLLSSFDEDAGYFQFATAMSSKDPQSLKMFLEESVAGSCEGLIFKSTGVDSKYEPGKRNWLKLKKDFIQSMWDSLDLVPIGAFYGSGKRTGVYGTFLLACYDPSTEEFQTISNAGTGFSDQFLDDCHKSFQSKVITNPKPNYIYNADKIQPDVWFEPSETVFSSREIIVFETSLFKTRCGRWEVKAGGLTISPVHSAATGLVDSTKGLSLRNPTLLRVRKDKVPEMATTTEQVAEMYSRQWQMFPGCASGEVDEAVDTLTS